MEEEVDAGVVCVKNMSRKNHKRKFFIFSDESGSWHEDDGDNIYLRSWVVISEKEYYKLKNKIQGIVSSLNCTELKWKTLAGDTGKKYISKFENIDFRICITISVPSDINWSEKYNVTKKFDQSMSSFDFGNMDGDLVATIKEKVLNDIKYVLFLNYYEKTHILNATKMIEGAIKPQEHKLIYRIDPPQSNKKDWGKILNSITNKQLEFPKSQKDEGIQFADIVAGAFKSLCTKDKRYNQGVTFFKKNKKKFFDKNAKIPNPNLIFYSEINKKLKNSIKDIWEL